MAVLDVEELALGAVRIEDDPAVRHHPVHVEQHQLYFFQAINHKIPN